ncbi:hypothetical protein MSA03_17050 [Microbacterium saccharophilum]|nr:hypothetical protein MSA03_17050 [Microbacterium saccharophilum]
MRHPPRVSVRVGVDAAAVSLGVMRSGGAVGDGGRWWALVRARNEANCRTGCDWWGACGSRAPPVTGDPADCSVDAAAGLDAMRAGRDGTVGAAGCAPGRMELTRPASHRGSCG